MIPGAQLRWQKVGHRNNFNRLITIFVKLTRYDSMCAQKEILLFFALAVSGITYAGCDCPHLTTTNGINYKYVRHCTGQKKTFKTGDSVFFFVKASCPYLSDSVRIYFNGIQIFSGYDYKSVGVNIKGQQGHYVVTTEWDSWAEMIWEFDFEEVKDTTTDSLPAKPPAPSSIKAIEEDPQLIFNFTSQSFSVTGNDIINTVLIRDLSGRVVFSLAADSRSANLDFLPEGIYVVEIRTKMENILLKKLVLN
jgi:hypothetical protein